jgi:hypothetical protein
MFEFLKVKDWLLKRQMRHQVKLIESSIETLYTNAKSSDIEISNEANKKIIQVSHAMKLMTEKRFEELEEYFKDIDVQ